MLGIKEWCRLERGRLQQLADKTGLKKQYLSEVICGNINPRPDRLNFIYDCMVGIENETMQDVGRVRHVLERALKWSESKNEALRRFATFELKRWTILYTEVLND